MCNILTPNNPHYSRFVQVIEPTIIRYTCNGRWYEIHRTNAMLSMFGYDRYTSFADMPRSILCSIIFNFHDSAFDCTIEMHEEKEEISASL
jgi:hypothetical protein